MWNLLMFLIYFLSFFLQHFVSIKRNQQEEKKDKEITIIIQVCLKMYTFHV